jgi:hypothetical protein
VQLGQAVEIDTVHPVTVVKGKTIGTAETGEATG